MNRKLTDPHYEFRVFGHEFGPLLNPLLDQPSRNAHAGVKKTGLSMVEVAPDVHDEGTQTYLLTAHLQNWSIKVRTHKLDTKVLLRQQQGLERWQPHLQLAFPLTAAFLQEFLFAWLEIEPPRLLRPQYTEAQFLQELIAPNSAIGAVQVHKQRRCFTINSCTMAITALTVNNCYHTYTVVVKAVEAEKVLDTITRLGLHAFANTNYGVGLSQLVGLDTPTAMAQPDTELGFALASRPTVNSGTALSSLKPRMIGKAPMVGELIRSRVGQRAPKAGRPQSVDE